MKKNLILIVTVLLVALGCSTDYEILKPQENIILTADASVKKQGEVITFMVKNAEGADYTADALFFVDGTKIEGNTFTSAQAGNFEVTAEYNTVMSAPLLVNFHDGTGVNFRKNMLIEDYTGTWCGYCPRVAAGVERVHNQTEDAIAVAIHRPSSSIASPVYDPYNFEPAAELEATLAASGYPKGYLNRTMLWTKDEPDHVSEAIALTQGANPKLGLALSPVVANASITLDVDVMFGKDFTNNLKLVVYVLENGLIYDQHNYTSYYGGEKLLKDFEHNHVLRACLTPILGEAIDASKTTIGATYTKSFTVTVPSTVTDPTKMEFVAFVIDETGTVVNVRKAKSGDKQQIQLL